MLFSLLPKPTSSIYAMKLKNLLSPLENSYKRRDKDPRVVKDLFIACAIARKGSQHVLQLLGVHASSIGHARWDICSEDSLL
jgi:hypothetical protein